MSDDFSRLRAVFHEAVERFAPEEWDAYLDQACAGQEGLRSEAAMLLKAHAEGGHPTGAFATAEASSTVIGPYKLLERIGEGGMGEVWMAQQTEPVRRKVAVKLIKAGMDSRQVVARFEAERQALALMDHPNIAKVLDGGSTDSGRPYFVMELVKGAPITRYCDEHKLTPRERLELFLPVCQAVQHAHQKGVIHRDLKPTNVLVALYDGRPVPKVIDFGVAKAAGVELTDKTLFTGFGSVVGTLEYMSPEQAELNNLDIDTRSDVYSLGVMLYELLTGTTPLESKRLKATSLLEALRLIREEEPLTPSTKLSTAKELPAIAASRGVDQWRLSGLVRGEVDWIVMKCLEKDRGRRYDTANGLARDLERYLGDEPVLACPPSAGYRLRKFARRNRAALAVVGVVVAGLVLTVAGLAVSTYFIWRAKNEAVQALDKEQLSSYWQRIALAERELASNNLALCQELLARCPEQYHGWEWRYLKRATGKALPPLRHDHTLYRLAVSPDGKRVVCPDAGGFVSVWDVATGARLLHFRGHQRFADRVAFSPDGSYFVTTTYDPGGRSKCEVKAWNAHTGAEMAKWLGPYSGIGAMAFSPDGRLACGFFDEGQDGDLDLRDPLTGKVLLRLGTAKLGTIGLAFSPDGRLLAEVTNGDEARLWDVRAGRRERSFPLPSQPSCVALSGDGRLFAVGFGEEGEKGGGKVLLWEAETGRERSTLTGHRPLCVRFSPDDSRIATGGIDQSVKLWDVASGHEVLTLRGHQDWVYDLAFTPDGHRLISASNDNTVRVWDARPIGDGEKIGEELLTLVAGSSGAKAVAFHPARPLLATGGFDGTVRLWDSQTGRRVWSRKVPLTRVEAVAFSPDGRLLAAGGTPAPAVVILDASNGDVVPRPPGGADSVFGLAFSPDGKLLAEAGNEAVVLRDAATWREVGRLRGHLYSVYDPSFHRVNGKLLLATADSMARAVRVWDADSGKELPGVRLTHQGVVYGVAFSPAGGRLVSGGWDRMARLWDTTKWKQVDAQRDFTGAVQGVAFSPDGRLVAWASTDSTVKVWHLASGEVTTLRGHTDVVFRVAFSPDGTRIASASQDGTAKVWETPKFQ